MDSSKLYIASSARDRDRHQYCPSNRLWGVTEPFQLEVVFGPFPYTSRAIGCGHTGYGGDAATWSFSTRVDNSCQFDCRIFRIYSRLCDE